MNSSVFAEVEAMLLSSQMSSATILRVLQDLSSLASSLNKAKDYQLLPYRDHDESVIIIRSLKLTAKLLW